MARPAKQSGISLDQEAVLARWQETRSPRLADLLCAAPLPRWKARLKDISEKVPTRTWAIRLIRELPDDPRTSLFFIQMLETANWAGPNSRELWGIVFDRLVTLRDVRCVPKLRAFVETPPHFYQAKLTTWVADECARVADALARVKIAKDDARTVRLAEAQQVVPPKDGFFKVVSTQSVDALLAQVWAAPDDLELRAVIGDALQEHGDPRGELIALQCAKRPKTQAIERLLRKHSEPLAGPIGQVISHPMNYKGSPLTFAAGFLDACIVGAYFATFRDWAEAAVAPHWTTVRRVRFTGTIPKRKWFKSWWESGKLGLLRTVEMWGVILERTAAGAPWRIKRAPRRLRDVELDDLALLFGTMPRAELGRIELPPQLQALGARA